ncbi:hypothetical protein QYE76_066272 [Lolium multiflorum]|uniref:Uncharacterized protein n=1 Tax=Lolium multiflorum TaxID=4521 RepID=A0AAD8WBY4_LOLMU|nr:hypothetical protein QYE76_066272 [Lolium multiflorum]
MDMENANPIVHDAVGSKRDASLFDVVPSKAVAAAGGGRIPPGWDPYEPVPYISPPNPYDTFMDDPWNEECTPGLEAMLKEFISTQTAFNKSVEEKLDKIDTIASRVDRLASDVNLLKLKVMPNNDIDNKITTTANAIQVRINENIRLMAELRARWDREENEKLAKENNVAKVWTITTTSNVNASHVAAPPTINGKIIGVGNVSTPSAKRTKLPEIAKTAETACDKTAEIFSNLGNNDPIAVAHNDLDFDDCHISEVIKFLQKLAKSPNASAINLAFTKHITNALIKAREEKLKLETSIPRKLEDGWEPIIKMKFNDFECNALCDLGASISVMPKKIYDMLDLPPLKNCYLDVNLADNVKKKPLGRIDNLSGSDVGSDDEHHDVKTRQVLRRLQVGQYVSYFAKGVYRCPFCTRRLGRTDFNCLLTHAENIGNTNPKVGASVNPHSFRAKHMALGMHLRSIQRVEISAGRMPPLKPKAPKGSNKWRQMG